MDGNNEDNKNNINNDKSEEKNKKENKNDEKGKNNNNYNSNRKKKYKVDVNKEKEDENEDLYISQQRSYSCRIGDQKSKKFNYNNEEIENNIKRKLKFLKTPQIKPKKSKVIPNPISLGTISFSNKKSKFNIIKNDNIILSEGEEEESNEYSSDSNSDFQNKLENNNINIDNNKEINNKENNNYINNEMDKVNDIKEFKIEEENDEYNEYGNLSIKNIRKNLIQSKKSVLKNIKNNNEIENILSEKYKKIKDNILNNNDNEEEVPKTLFKTIGFSKVNLNLPILNYLRKNSTSK